MEFGEPNIAKPRGGIIFDICTDCGSEFEHMDEDSIEARCPKCQSNWRIKQANKFHETGIFTDYIFEAEMFRYQQTIEKLYNLGHWTN